MAFWSREGIFIVRQLLEHGGCGLCGLIQLTGPFICLVGKTKGTEDGSPLAGWWEGPGEVDNYKVTDLN